MFVDRETGSVYSSHNMATTGTAYLESDWQTIYIDPRVVG